MHARVATCAKLNGNVRSFQVYFIDFIDAMGRDKVSIAVKLRKYTTKYKEFTSDGSVLFCTLCECAVAFDRSCHVDQHRSSKRHSSRLSDARQAAHQTLIQTISDNDDDGGDEHRPNKQEVKEFNKDLCQFFVANDIPLSKLDSDVSKLFLRKWTKRNVPHSTTLRKTTLRELYRSKLDEIRLAIGSKPIWISVDETTDKVGRYIAAVIVGSLSASAYQKPFLLYICREPTIRQSRS